MTKHTPLTYTEFIQKLIGPVTAIGDHGADERRLENLNTMIEVVYNLVDRIQAAADSADRPEASMKEIGQRAQVALVDLEEMITAETNR